MDDAGTAWLQGQRVAFTGRMASLTRAEAAELVRSHGGEYAPTLSRNTAFLVVGQEGWPLTGDGALAPRLRKAHRLQAQGAELTVLSEEEFLARLGFSPQTPGVHRLYSTAQLCRLLRITSRQLQTWVRTGLIRPVHIVQGVGYFDFQQVTSARTLIDLTRAGVTPERLRRSLGMLQTWLPDLRLPLAQLAVIERDGRVLVRLGDGQLAEPSGQGVFDFPEAAIPMTVEWKPSHRSAEEWTADAHAYEEAERWEEAAEAYRQALLLTGPDAQLCFELGNVLFALGQRPRAAERFRQAVEIDPAYVDAWNNLGNVLADLGETEEGLDALRKAIELDPGYVDAHYNLADVLDSVGRREEAQPHWEAYLRYDACSEWATYARSRLRKGSG